MSGDGTHVRGLAGRGWAWGVGGRVAAVAVIVCGWPATIVVCTAMHIWSNRSLCASLLLTSVPAVSARQRPGELSAKGMLQSGRQMCCLKVVGQAVAWEALAQKEGWPGSGPGPVGGLGAHCCYCWSAAAHGYLHRCPSNVSLPSLQIFSNMNGLHQPGRYILAGAAVTPPWHAKSTS